MNDPVVKVAERNVSYNFMAAEAWWILSGKNDVESIKPYPPSMGNYSDDGLTFRGAYGPKVIDQVDYAVTSLINDIDSRQSVISIWRENPRDSKDIPCTLNLQFIMRNQTLHCIANMRSSDIWIGYIYDIFNFSCIAKAVLIEYCRRNRVNPMVFKLGELILNAGSQHLYDRNFGAASELIEGMSTAGVSVNTDIKINSLFKDTYYTSMFEFIDDLGEGKDVEFKTNKT